MKTKIGTEVAHVTRDSDTTFKVKGHRFGSVGCSIHHVTYLDANSLYATAQSPTGRGHSVAASLQVAQLVSNNYAVAVSAGIKCLSIFI